MRIEVAQRDIHREARDLKLTQQITRCLCKKPEAVGSAAKVAGDTEKEALVLSSTITKKSRCSEPLAKAGWNPC